jgi:hypothetical protein
MEEEPAGGSATEIDGVIISMYKSFKRPKQAMAGSTSTAAG